MAVNWIDIFLVFIIIISVLFGWSRGFILGFFDLARWIGSIILAYIFYSRLANFINWATNLSEMWTMPLAFLLIFLIAGSLIFYLGKLLVKRLPENVHQNKLNKILGIIPGFVSGLIMASVVAALLFALPFAGNFQNSLRDSNLAENFAVYSDELESALTPIFEDAVNETLTRRLTVYPGSEETVELPFKDDKLIPRSDLEAQMLDLINKERTTRGLAPIRSDPEMREVAIKHSADMFERGYFSHNTPEKKDPFDRMRDDEVRFRTAGENLALAPTLKIAHTGLMNSPGHRANILRPQFGRVGIGILESKRHGLMITQDFRN